LSTDERENIMAKSICLLYKGIFNGILDALEIDAEGEEIKCYLLGDDACVFKYELLVDEFEDADIDKEIEGKPISEFLSSL
ncbi:MAG: V4R domain-containing protein, partial [Promethearchaeota archaeon]